MTGRTEESDRFIDSFLVIWADSKLSEKDTNNKIKASINILRSITNSIATFDNHGQCVNYIENDAREDDVFLIVSMDFASKIIRHIKTNTKLKSIYILCLNQSELEQRTRKRSEQKVKGMFTNIEEIFHKIKEEVKQCQHDIISIHSIGTSTLIANNHLEASFMYSHLLKEILLSSEVDSQVLQQEIRCFVDFCRIRYVDNISQLSIIEEFNEGYQNQSPIWWYTRDCFIYLLLNRALQAQNIDILIKMSFFIRDLHRQIECIHKTRANQQTLTVYRGQGMTLDGFNRMKSNQGGLLSFNCFLSTSRSKQIALQFAHNARKKENNVVVLFRITIDPTSSSKPFASIDELSYFKGNEQETLFSMHTVFRIGQIKLLNDESSQAKIWNTELTLTNDDDKQLQQLTEHLRKDLMYIFIIPNQFNSDPQWRLSRLLVNMGEYEKAENLYKTILDRAMEANNLYLMQATHYQLAEISLLYRNNWRQAKIHLTQGLDLGLPAFDDIIFEQRDNMRDLFLSIKNHLCSQFVDHNQFESIMAELFIKMVEFYFKYSKDPLSPLEYQLVVDRYTYIGSVHEKQGKLTEALDYYNRAVAIIHQYLPPAHPRLATACMHISSIYATLNNYSIALEYLEKALGIQNKALPINHIHKAETYFRMSIVFQSLYKYESALRHAKFALDIGHQILTQWNKTQIENYQQHYDEILRLYNQYSFELIL